MKTRIYGVQCNYCLSRFTSVCGECGKIVCDKCVRTNKYFCPHCKSAWTENEEGKFFHELKRLEPIARDIVEGLDIDVPGLVKPKTWQIWKTSSYNRSASEYRNSINNQLKFVHATYSNALKSNSAKESKDFLTIRSDVLQNDHGIIQINDILSRVATAKRLFETSLTNLKGLSSLSGAFEKLYRIAESARSKSEEIFNEYKALHQKELDEREAKVKGQIGERVDWGIRETDETNENTLDVGVWDEMAKKKSGESK